jgi:hypothetical protein
MPGAQAGELEESDSLDADVTLMGLVRKVRGYF